MSIKLTYDVFYDTLLSLLEEPPIHSDDVVLLFTEFIAAGKIIDNYQSTDTNALTRTFNIIFLNQTVWEEYYAQIMALKANNTLLRIETFPVKNTCIEDENGIRTYI